jgi:hypothetical protein
MSREFRGNSIFRPSDDLWPQLVVRSGSYQGTQVLKHGPAAAVIF